MGKIYNFSLKDLWLFDRVSAYFLDASQNFPLHKNWYPFE